MKPPRPEIVRFIIFSKFLFNLFQLNQPNKRTRIGIFLLKSHGICFLISITMKKLPAMCSHRRRPSSPQSCVWRLCPRMKAGTATLIIYILRKYSCSKWRNTVAQIGEIQSLKLKKCSRSSKRNTVAQNGEIQFEAGIVKTLIAIKSTLRERERLTFHEMKETEKKWCKNISFLLI